MKRFLSFFLTTVVFIVSTTFHVLAEDDRWDLQSRPMIIGTPQPPLEVKMNGSEGRNSYDFLERVGGIAFEAVAIPEKRSINQKIELSYDKSQPDGKRLAVSIKGQIYHPVLPDWELVPIANYANSEYNAIVSLFGHNSGGNLFSYFERISSENVYNITYHPAFNNTLLGVRLLQADIIFMDLDNFWQLPQLKHKTILGYGENQNSVSRQDSQQAAQEISEVFKGENKTFQSWLLNDFGVKVAFNVQGNNLNLSGEPYYYFWRADLTEYKRQRAEYERQLAEYKKQADSLPILQRNEIVEKHNALVQKINSLQPKVFEVSTLTEGMKAKFNSLYKFNPVVYEAATRTMRYAAFFRYVKTHNTSSWQKFLKQLETVKVEPDVKTPTEWDKTQLIKTINNNDNQEDGRTKFLDGKIRMERNGF